LSYYPEFKPTSTKINICYNDDHAEIILLDQITNIYEIFLLILSQILICILSPLFWFISFFISIFLAQLINTISSFAFCLCLNVIFNVVNQIKDERIFKIIIDDNSISAFNFWNRLILSNSRSEISLLGYSPSYEFDQFLDSSGTQQNRGKVVTKSELFIYAGSNKYLIKNLSADEFWWLGHELSAILNLELNIIYPTPKVPPEPSSCGCGC
jgi:hypothetical protein